MMRERIERFVASCIVALACCAADATAGEDGYCSQPALHGDRLVFASEGDLWTARIPADAAQTILAHRLTSHDGDESRPFISPDGTRIAFTGQYDGNVDVFVMPLDGGAPKRLTFHPGDDEALGWTADGRSVLFRSRRSQPLGRPELWRAPIAGGMPERYDFGECSMAAINSGGKLIAFTRWSNEHWTWKGYRGGTAPEIWLGEFVSGRYWPLTNDPGNDLFPMWLQGRVYFLSDRTGAPNIFSDTPRGDEPKQHTNFAPTPDDPTAIDGYDIRWPSADAEIRGTRIVFAQGGRLALLDVSNDSVRRLDVKLVSDRAARRQRFTAPTATFSEFSLSPDGSRLLIGTRGEIVSLEVDNGGRPVQLTRSSGAREFGAVYLGDDNIVLISDATGEQQIALGPPDGSSPPLPITTDREDWLFPPVAAPDAGAIAFADKTQRLHVLDMQTRQRTIVDRSDAWEITDYRFSPDGQWLAYVKPMPSGFSRIYLYAVRTGRTFPISDGLHNEHHPRWDPKGQYLYFLADADLNPMMGLLDFEHTFQKTMQVWALPLSSSVPPPIGDVADLAGAGFDLEKWADADSDEGFNAATVTGAEAAAETMRVDTDGMAERLYRLPLEADTYAAIEAVFGGVCLLKQPLEGLMDEVWPPPPPGVGRGTLVRFNCLQEETTSLAEKVSTFTVNQACDRVAYPVEGGVAIRLFSEEEPHVVSIADLPLRVSIEDEWRQIFDEAWRLQRDFYWAPNMRGLDWAAVKQKYAALLPRIATREELNDLIGEMIGELRTSHTYIWGGELYDEAPQVPSGLLGCDLVLREGSFRIERILPDFAWDASLRSPLAMPHLGVKEGDRLLAIDGVELTGSMNPYDLLQGLAGRPVSLTIADANGGNERTIAITALEDESTLRYVAWVEANRRYIEEATEGALGYVHIPDMGGPGLVAFSRYFYPQIRKKGLIVDIRDNGGGFVSQMIIERLARRVWAFMQPRHGATETFPSKALHGHMVVLIDEHAGSDGDIFPESFRLRGLGPLIGTRTWGGVVGIRMDKPFVDLGLSSQPEFAWWEPVRGWSLENSGVSPDFEVHITPADRTAGADPQLEKAIEVLMQKVRDEPMDLPPTPPFPDGR